MVESDYDMSHIPGIDEDYHTFSKISSFISSPSYENNNNNTVLK